MSTTEPRGLLVTKEFSLAPTSGGTLRSLALAQELSRDYAMTVISPDGVWQLGPGEPPAEVPTEAGASPGGGRPGWIDLWTVARYRSISGVRTAGARLVDQLGRGAHGRYDVALLDHTCVAGLADWIAVGCESLLVSMHNVESGLMSQRAAAATGPAALAMRAESALLRRLERHVCARYPVVVCTDADAATLGGAPVIVCRNGVFDRSQLHQPSDPSQTEEPRPSRGSSVVFSGALDWEPNIEGVLWFASQVWPRVRARRPQATATIAGRHPGAAVREACRAPGLTLLPDPPVMAEVLARHRIGIVPLLTGGGSRIKILEYLAAGLLVVSTDLGASGLEDVPEEFARRTPTDPQALADALVENLPEPAQQQAEHLAGGGDEQGKRAADWVRAGYSWPVTVRPLLDFLRDPPAR